MSAAAAAPNVTVTTCVSNEERYVGSTLESALAQDVPAPRLTANDRIDGTFVIAQEQGAQDGPVTVSRQVRHVGVIGNFRRPVGVLNASFFFQLQQATLLFTHFMLHKAAPWAFASARNAS